MKWKMKERKENKAWNARRRNIWKQVIKIIHSSFRTQKQVYIPQMTKSSILGSMFSHKDLLSSCHWKACLQDPLQHVWINFRRCDSSILQWKKGLPIVFRQDHHSGQYERLHLKNSHNSQKTPQNSHNSHELELSREFF